MRSATAQKIYERVALFLREEFTKGFYILNKSEFLKIFHKLAAKFERFKALFEMKKKVFSYSNPNEISLERKILFY